MSRSPFEAVFQSLTNRSENKNESRLQIIKQDQTLDLNTSKELEKNYYTQFKSLASEEAFNVVQPTTINIQRSAAYQSRINKICEIREPAFAFKSNIGATQDNYKKLIINPGFYSFKQSSLALKQNVDRINRELGSQIRVYFKGQQIKEDTEETLDLRFLDFETYSKTIAEKYNNQLFQSILKNYGALQIDQQVHVPERYEVKQRKIHHTIGTETGDQFVQRPSKPQLTKISMMKIDIQKTKSRMQRTTQYFQLMKEKLVDFFNYVLENDANAQRLPITNKIKFVLANLNNYKHQLRDGQSKITLLLFFIKQFHSLKQQEQKFQRKNSKASEVQTKRNFSHTPTKQKYSMADSAKTNTHSKTKGEHQWIGLMQRHD